jgi:hypothetical protein
MEAFKVKRIIVLALFTTAFLLGASYLKTSMRHSQHSHADSNMLTDGYPISIGLLHREAEK